MIERLKNIDEMSKSEMHDLLSIIANIPSSIMNFDKPLRNGEHPTMKPIPLIAYLVGNSTRRNEVVLDFFGGSGSTLMACEQLGRKCRTIEYEPIYVDVIIKRWEEFTGKKAEYLGNFKETENKKS